MAELKPSFIPASEVIGLRESAIIAEREMSGVSPQTLAGYVRGIWESNKRAKLTVDAKMLALRRRLNGIIEPDKLKALRSAGMPEDYFRLTARKARDVEGWVSEVFNQYQERTWDVVPLSDPELSPSEMAQIEKSVVDTLLFSDPRVQNMIAMANQQGVPVDLNAVRAVAQSPEFKQMAVAQADQMKEEVLYRAKQIAEKKCTRLEEKIEDELHESGYYTALRECFKDLSELLSCVLKGPILRKEKVLEAWDGENPIVTEKVVKRFYRVNPFDYFPCADSKHPQDGPTCELEHFKPTDLQKMIGVPGYKEDVLRKILKENRNGRREITPVTPEKSRLEHQNTSAYADSTSSTIDSIDFWGDVPGELLIQWGIEDSESLDPDISYSCNVKMVGSDVYRAMMNPDPLGDKPYQVTSFVKSNDSQWGTAPAELGASIEDFCMNTIRMLVKNMSISGAPMFDVNIDKLADDEDVDVYPTKTFISNSRTMNDAPAVRIIQANLLSGELWSLYEAAAGKLDYIIAPSFGSGSVNQGGGRTASGLAMIMNSESRNLKVVVGNVDHDLQLPAVERIFRQIMLFDDDLTLKGGLRFKARGIGAQLIKEGMTQRRSEFMTQTMNPVDLKIFSEKGRAYMWLDQVKDLGWDVKQAIPGYSDIESQPAQPQVAPGQPQQQIAEASQQASMQPGTKAIDVSGRPMSDY
jgi:hypothetical protein